jgi:hypothetical protein
MNSDRRPRPLDGSVPVLVTTRIASASSTPEMKCLVPLMLQASPSRVALVDRRCELDPASGSVIANTILRSPVARPGSQRSRCSGVPKRARMVPQIAGETISSISGQPWAASSSATIASSVMPMPPPPWRSGMLTPRNPAAPTSRHSSTEWPPLLTLSLK